MKLAQLSLGLSLLLHCTVSEGLSATDIDKALEGESHDAYGIMIGANHRHDQRQQLANKKPRALKAGKKSKSSTKAGKKQPKSFLNDDDKDDDNDNEPLEGPPMMDQEYVWTKLGLEKIPWSDWEYFTEGGMNSTSASSSLYIKNFPFPGDSFTQDHYDAWIYSVDPTVESLEDLVGAGYLMKLEDKDEAMKVYTQYSSVPTLFSDPMIISETPIDYRFSVCR